MKKKKKRIYKKKAIKIESPSLFWVFLLITFLVILVIGCAQKPEEYPLIFDAGSVEHFASLNKTDLIISGELPKTPWE